MKKLISIIGLFVLIILSPAISVFANYSASENGTTSVVLRSSSSENGTTDVVQNRDFHYGKQRSLTAYIKSVNTDSKIIGIRNLGFNKNVLASNALVIIITDNGAKEMTLADLKINFKTNFWVNRINQSNAYYDAILIVQDQTTYIKNTPSTPSRPTVQFSYVSSSGSESVSPVSIPVMLSDVANEDVTVRYTVSGTATGGGVDYTLSSGHITIPKGQTSATLSLSIANDTQDEPDETVVISLYDSENAHLGTNNMFTYTIQDNADQPTVGFSSVSSSAQDTVPNVSIPVVLSKVSTHSVSVTYTVSGTATGSGVDYTLPNGTLTIPAGSTSANINLAVVHDTVADPNETVVITLSNPTWGTLGTAIIHTHTILE